MAVKYGTKHQTSIIFTYRLQARLDEWQQLTGFPRLPINATYREETVRFFTDIQREFPDIYGEDVNPYGMFSFPLEVDISHDPAELAEFFISKCCF